MNYESTESGRENAGERVLLTKEDILGVKDVVIKKVFVKEWNSSVYLRSLSGRDRERYEWTVYSARQKGKLGELDLRPLLLSKTLCDSEGNLLFGEKDISALAKKNASALEFLFNEAQELCGMSKQAIDGLTENLLEGQSGD